MKLNIHYMQKIEKWDRRYLDVAKVVSTWSKDPSSQIGAVIVNTKGRIVSTGFNGFPRRVNDAPERYNNRELKYKLVVHAEANACIAAGHEANGSTIYVYPGWGPPCLCTECCKTVIQSGIHRVVGLIRKVDEDKKLRWKESLELAQMMCDEAGLSTIQYQEI